MTCNECVHFEACKRMLKTAFPSVTAEEIEKESSRDNNCTLFKNKADVVEVVRCKDCKYKRVIFGRPPIAVCVCTHNRGLGDGVKEDDFCRYGERKTE